MAEDVEKRVTHLESDLSKSMNQVARSLASLSQSLSEQEGTLYDMRAIQTQHGRDIRDTKAEVKLLQGNVLSLRSEVKALQEEVKAGFAEVLEALKRQRE